VAHVERGQNVGHADLDDLRRRLLEARDRRASSVAWRSHATPAEGPDGEGETVVFVSLNVPGADKDLPGIDALFEGGLDALRDALPGLQREQEGCDALGRWALLAVPGRAEDVKRRCVAVEEAAPANRLLDLDVYVPGGRQLDRAQLGLPPRTCLVCPHPAAECIRLRRHSPGDLEAAVQQLLK
jgi:holo-ACP synthase CitX